MGRFILNMPDDDMDRLRNLSEKTGVPIAEYVRRSVKGFLNGPSEGQLIMSGTLASGCVMMVLRGN